MKTALVLASVLLALVEATLILPKTYKTTSVNAEVVVKQKKILQLFRYPKQVDTEADYYKIGKDYDIEANKGDYTDVKKVEEFLSLWKSGFLAKNEPFSIFYRRQKEEAVALFNIFVNAKDFETFYKTAAFARVNINEGQFLYAYYIALVYRPDTKGVVVPAPYEVYPDLFTNSDVWNKIYRIKMQNGIVTPDFGAGVVKEENRWVVYSNYSYFSTYPENEFRLAYFTEDIGINAFFYSFHTYFPFWMSKDLNLAMKDRRGQLFFYFYQQLIARYYLERLSNGLGKLPDFSWWNPIKTGYNPYFSSFAQRPSYYTIPYEHYYEELQLLSSYKMTFSQWLQPAKSDVDLLNSKSRNFVDKARGDSMGKVGLKDSDISFDDFILDAVMAARCVLGAAPKSVDKYTFKPTSLDYYQTSLRDPIFYQMYSKILNYFMVSKKRLPPYTPDVLNYFGVKINDVTVDKLVTYFDYFDFDVTNNVFFNKDELKSKNHSTYVVRQRRLNNRAFTITVDVKSDVEGEAVFKIFIGPKYDNMNNLIHIEDNWQNFVQLDSFVHKLTKGNIQVPRISTDFFSYNEDSVPVWEIYNLLSEGKVPTDMSTDMSNKFANLPKRFILPKGTKGGFPLQLFVMAYPYTPAEKNPETIKPLDFDDKPLGYPFDRPAHEIYFKQTNMFFKDVTVYHEEKEFT